MRRLILNALESFVRTVRYFLSLLFIVKKYVQVEGMQSFFHYDSSFYYKLLIQEM